MFPTGGPKAGRVPVGAPRRTGGTAPFGADRATGLGQSRGRRASFGSPLAAQGAVVARPVRSAAEQRPGRRELVVGATRQNRLGAGEPVVSGRIGGRFGEALRPVVSVEAGSTSPCTPGAGGDLHGRRGDGRIRMPHGEVEAGARGDPHDRWSDARLRMPFGEGKGAALHSVEGREVTSTPGVLRIVHHIGRRTGMPHRAAVPGCCAGMLCRDAASGRRAGMPCRVAVSRRSDSARRGRRPCATGPESPHRRPRAGSAPVFAILSGSGCRSGLSCRVVVPGCRAGLSCRAVVPGCRAGLPCRAVALGCRIGPPPQAAAPPQRTTASPEVG